MCDIMKKIFVFVCMLAMFMSVANAQWKPAGERIKTQWGEQLNPQNVLPDYPRPIMERSDWKNLNGLWDYAIVQKGSNLPKSFQGQILVPFAVESSLSATPIILCAQSSPDGRFSESYW